MRFTTIRLNLRSRRLRHEIAHCFVGMTITNPQKMDCYIFAGFVVQWYKYCQIRSKSHLAVHLYYNRGILSIHEWRNIFVDICFPNHRPDVPHLRALSSLFLLLGTISPRSCLFFTLSALSSAIEQLLHAPHWILFKKKKRAKFVDDFMISFRNYVHTWTTFAKTMTRMGLMLWKLATRKGKMLKLPQLQDCML